MVSDRTLILRNCRLVNVYSGEIYSTDITISGDRIVSTEKSLDATVDEIVECDGMYAIPGLIDPHMHVDTTSLWPGELARVLVPLGTTSVVVDMSNVISTGGPEAVQGLMDSFEGLPLRGLFAMASYSPLDPTRETVAYELTTSDLDVMLGGRSTVGIGETVSSKILATDEDYLSRIALTLSRGQRVSGHGGDLPRGDESAFDAYVAAGVRDDHCVMLAADVQPRLRRGMSLFTVESSGRENLSNGLLDYIRDARIPTRFIHFCIDNITVMSIVGDGFGYLDRSVRLAARAAIPPVEVARMGSLNTAEHYGLGEELGGIAPGRLADILLVRELDDFPPAVVISGGQIVARDGELLVDIPKPDFPVAYQHSVKLHESVDVARLALRTQDDISTTDVRVIHVTDQDAAFNSAETATLQVADGIVQSDTAQDVLKICVVERYNRNGNVCVGFATGFGIKRGAVATTVSVPSNNIVAVGTTDEDIWAAISHVADMRGGYTVVVDGVTVAEVPLPVGGIISDERFENVVDEIRTAEKVTRDVLGGSLNNPLRALTGTVLPTLPDFGMTDLGLVDVAKRSFVPVLINVKERAL